MTKQEQAKQMIKQVYDYPVDFANKILGINTWEKQDEIIDSVKNHKRTSVRSCNSAGKTLVAAFIALWFLYSHSEAIVVLVAPRMLQIQTQIFAEISRLYNTSNYDLGGELKKQSLWVSDKSFIICAAVESGDRSLDSLRGYHAKYILFIADESSGISPEAFSAIDGSLSTPQSKLLLISNPQRRSGTFFDSFNKDKELYNNIHISKDDVLQSERAQAIEGLGTEDFYNEIKIKYGENSGEYKIKALGEFPLSDSDFSIIPEVLVREALTRQEPEPIDDNREDMRAIKEVLLDNEPVIAVDVALEGRDRSVILLREGLRMRILKSFTKNDTIELVAEVKDIVKEYYNSNGIYPKIAVDSIGVGAGVYDLLRNDSDPDIASRVVGIQFGARAQRNDLYYNTRAEAYDLLKQFTRFGCIHTNDTKEEQSFLDMSYIQYKRDNQYRIQLERKDELVKRLTYSPDVPDSAAMSLVCSMIEQNNGLEFSGVF